MAGRQEKSMLTQGAILAGASLLTKLIGFLYRIPMANLLGDEGNGIYSVSFGIYNIALTLSSCAIPLAVSKLVAARLARNRERDARRVFWDTLLLAVALGGCAALVLWSGAEGLEALYHRPGLALPLRVLAPTTFVVALLGAFRGWFQGQGNMLPTACSQVAEQIVNAVVSVVAAWQLMLLHEALPAYGAAGGTLGTLAGALTALAMVAGLFFFRRPLQALPRQREESHRSIYRALVVTVVPVILSQTVYQIGYTLDDLIFGNVMAAKGVADSAVSAMQGVFNTQYNQLVNLPVAVATAMAATVVPGIAAARARGSRREVSRKITSVVKFCMVLAIPSAVGLAILAGPMMELLFYNLTHSRELAASLLHWGSSAAVFFALSTITTAILQASDRMTLPLWHCALSLLLHLGLVYVLLQFTDLGVYALLIGNVSFPLLVSVLNCRAVSRCLGYRWRFGRLFVLPLLCAAVMGLATWGGDALLALLPLPGLLRLGLVLLLSIGIYGYLILRLHCFGDAQLLELPWGEKLLALSKRLDGRM